MVDKDMMALHMSQLCVALSGQADDVHAAEQYKIMHDVTLRGMILRQQVSALAQSYYCGQHLSTTDSMNIILDFRHVMAQF